MTTWGFILILLAAILAVSFLVFLATLAIHADPIEALMPALGTFAALLGAAIGIGLIVFAAAWIGTATGAFG